MLQQTLLRPTSNRERQRQQHRSVEGYLQSLAFLHASSNRIQRHPTHPLLCQNRRNEQGSRRPRRSPTDLPAPPHQYFQKESNRLEEHRSHLLLLQGHRSECIKNPLWRALTKLIMFHESKRLGKDPIHPITFLNHRTQQGSNRVSKGTSR